MDISEAVDSIFDAVHETVSDDPFVNERAAKAVVWDLLEEFSAQCNLNRIDDLEGQLESAESEIEAYRERYGTI